MIKSVISEVGITATLGDNIIGKKRWRYIGIFEDDFKNPYVSSISPFLHRDKTKVSKFACHIRVLQFHSTPYIMK